MPSICYIIAVLNINRGLDTDLHVARESLMLQSVLLSCMLAHDDSIQLARKLFFHLHTAQHKEQPAQHKETDFSVLLWSMIKGCDCKNVKRDQQTQRVHTPTTQ